MTVSASRSRLRIRSGRAASGIAGGIVHSLAGRLFRSLGISISLPPARRAGQLALDAGTLASILALGRGPARTDGRTEGKTMATILKARGRTAKDLVTPHHAGDQV